MDIRNLLLPQYREVFPENLLVALKRYVDELSDQLDRAYEGEQDLAVWWEYDLTLNSESFDNVTPDVMGMEDAEAFETFGECEVLSYKMVKWLKGNVKEYDSLPLKLLSIINLNAIPKSDAVVVAVDKENDCLELSLDYNILGEEEPCAGVGDLPIYDAHQSLGYFTWPEELLPLYQRKQEETK